MRGRPRSWRPFLRRVGRDSPRRRCAPVSRRTTRANSGRCAQSRIPAGRYTASTSPGRSRASSVWRRTVSGCTRAPGACGRSPNAADVRSCRSRMPRAARPRSPSMPWCWRQGGWRTCRPPRSGSCRHPSRLDPSSCGWHRGTLSTRISHACPRAKTSSSGASGWDSSTPSHCSLSVAADGSSWMPARRVVFGTRRRAPSRSCGRPHPGVCRTAPRRCTGACRRAHRNGTCAPCSMPACRGRSTSRDCCGRRSARTRSRRTTRLCTGPVPGR